MVAESLEVNVRSAGAAGRVPTQDPDLQTSRQN
jgi:hypothetical protein